MHTYVGSKADVLRAVLARDEGIIASAGPANPNLIESANLMLHHGLGQDSLVYFRLVERAALRESRGKRRRVPSFALRGYTAVLIRHPRPMSGRVSCPVEALGVARLGVWRAASRATADASAIPKSEEE